ncbi:Fc receptor-like protein 2 isoform X3 [Polyodon spathula]|uniref:Fc receptor-like protein 2 isoform X3 n=1 Tax=Polyodon spathula TaxID=7913 RepID=UPI001B7F69D9|nr:Fc receptor-like protein 2 isoform X3 [Polyodon spathula]
MRAGKLYLVILLTTVACFGDDTERPQAVLTQEPAWTQLFRSESVTLRCQVQGDYTGWRFTWYKVGRKVPIYQDYYSRIDGGRYTISSVTRHHSGKYTCKGERSGNPSYSKTSNALTLTVSELFSTPTLTVKPGASVWEGEDVSLQCGAQIYKQGTQLQYRYSKDNEDLTGAGSQYSIPAAGLRDTGSYQCEVEAAGTGVKKRSESVWLSIRELFSTPTLTVKPSASVWEGEDVSLQCGAQIYKQGTQLQYRYSKDNEDLRGAGSQYSIPAAGLRDTGRYQCEVEAAGMGVKKRSDSVWLSIRERPQAVLTQEPAWTQLYETESVTLRCQVQGDYKEWRFTWYKDGRNDPVTQHYYSIIDGKYTISSATRDHSGEYTCKGERSSNPSYSKTSDALTLSVSADKPKFVLTQEPAGEIFEGDSVTLSCDGGSDGWRYLWFKDSEDTPVLQTAGRSITDDSYTITAAAVSDQGQYWCRGQRGDEPLSSQLSDKVILNITGEFINPSECSK